MVGNGRPRRTISEPMSNLSHRQHEIREREAVVLKKARELLLTEGYFGMTMDRIAEASAYPKGTIYQRFTCKEDVVLALARQCIEKRFDMVRRGASYPGRARERMAALGEAVALFARLHPDDSRIIHNAGGPIREKGSPERVEALTRLEHKTARFVNGIVADAVAQGDLELVNGLTVEHVTFALSSLVEGSYAMMENGVPQNALAMAYPVQEMWWAYNRLVDAFGWRPLFAEGDWEEVLAQVRRTIFPEETQQVYGAGCWYGDEGQLHTRDRIVRM